MFVPLFKETLRKYKSPLFVDKWECVGSWLSVKNHIVSEVLLFKFEILFLQTKTSITISWKLLILECFSWKPADIPFDGSSAGIKEIKVIVGNKAKW